MNSTRIILPVALVAALLGGSVGAFVMRAPKPAATANNTSTAAPALTDNTTTANQAIPVSNETGTTTLTGEQAAFRDGFQEGFLAAQENGATSTNYGTVDQSGTSSTYSSTRARSVGNSTSQSRAYRPTNNYTQPRSRSFWQKHRDKLTVAAGAGGGALIGGLLGGKKGALIGGLAGGGGSALYTYKLRKKTPQY